MKRYVNSGIRFNGRAWEFDEEHNLPDDIIDLVSPQLYESTLNNDLYWFGYRFNENTSSRQRSKFIADLKGYGDDPFSDIQLKRIIEKPLGELDEMINIYSLDCFVYPSSKRSKLVSMMMDSILNYTSRNMSVKSFEFVKSAPRDIEFDWDRFESKYKNLEDLSTYRNMKSYVENTLMPAIHNLDYFSIAQSVKSKYRSFIKNFLNFKNPEDLEAYSKLQGKKILVLDDINTTGSTLHEILRILNEINHDCKIFIYSLIGRY